jgi:alpha-tubulin N-acetyltransferase 1
MTCEDNRIYVGASGNKVYGILKVGKKKLFHHDAKGCVKELQPLCVLDFYVHESVQRAGIGKVLC